VSSIATWLPLVAVLAPALATVGIVAKRRNRALREATTFLGAGTAFAAVAGLAREVLAGRVHGARLATLFPEVPIALEADALGVLFALLASGLWIVTSAYSIGYLRGLSKGRQTRYFAAFAASVAATLGVAFAANLVTLFVFYELLTVATYPLVTHAGTDEARRAGRKYLAYTFAGGVLVLGGTVLVHQLAGTTSFAAGGLAALAEAPPALARTAFTLLVAGFGVKAAIMPLHAWLPDAMVAPTPVSGLLHAVAVVKSGVFGVARTVLEVLGPEPMAELGLDVPLAAAAALTIVLASLLALQKDNLKRRLAYSTISQLSYIVLGLALVDRAALVGGLFHVPAHGFMKLTLFFCAGTIYVETHTEEISEMAGVGRRLPLTMGAFAVAAAGMAGVPLVAGFASKFYLLVGAAGTGSWFFAGALVLSGVLNVAYFWPVVSQAFFEAEDEAEPKPIVEHDPGTRAPDRPLEARTPMLDPEASPWAGVGLGREASWFLIGPILVTATGAVLLGVAPDQFVFLDLVRDAVAEVVA
jgi:NADH-quinone oxidoreductase subunit L/multicomponent Na+:H+ antiporter subunit D